MGQPGGQFVFRTGFEVTGINSGDKAVDNELWGVWQDNGMDAESKLAHNAALVSGRAFALIWPDDDNQQPEITLDNSSQMVIRYREGSRRKREAAMRFWIDEDDKTSLQQSVPAGWDLQVRRPEELDRHGRHPVGTPRCA